MAMTLPIALPSTPTSGNSPAADGADRPRTPVSPHLQGPTDSQQPQSQANTAPTPAQSAAASAANSAQAKRKPSRRANTAERRATHNAVERQRRETLNGRFLDLAALLPNLSQIRRPSKSSIVNSSIAHIHASRRHRVLAARELRLVKLEADALRRELNEWRDRAGIPRIDEPIRGEGFSMVLSGELEVINALPGEEEEDEAGNGYGQYGGDDEDEYIGPAPTMMQPHMHDEMEDRHMAMLKNAAAVAANANPFAHSLPPPIVPTSATGPAHQGNGIHLSHVMPRSNPPGMMHSPSFDNPAAMAGLYDHSGAQFSHYMPPGPPQNHHNAGVDPEKLAAWNMYNQQHHQQQQMLQAQRSLFTPPATSHGLPSSTNSASNGNGGNPSGSPPGTAGGNPSPANGGASSNPFADPAFFVSLQRHQMLQQQQQQQQNGNGSNGSNNGYGGSSDRDDASSVGSISMPRAGGVGAGNEIQRTRSGSVLSAGSGGSGYGGSPPHHGGAHGGASPVGGYELGHGPTGPGAGRWGVRDVVEMGGVHHHGMGAVQGILPSPISAGGHGGGGGGFAMMM